jgi:methylated-DNA-[protein]-cysteine S-methyltransferase
MQPSNLPYSAIIDSPIGKLGIKISANKLCNIDFLLKQSTKNFIENKHAEIVVDQLQKYFKNSQHQFNLAMEINVTAFQQKVLHAMQKIPLGKTQTYGSVAKKLTTSPRAVGNACRSNPIPVIIPCHRIIGSAGIGGFAGATDGDFLAIKKWLLHHENVRLD